MDAECKCALYRDIFAEITFKAQPLCENESDPEWVTGYRLPVGPLHRAAGKLSFQMFNGEAHMTRLMNDMRELRDAAAAFLSDCDSNSGHDRLAAAVRRCEPLHNPPEPPPMTARKLKAVVG